VSNAGVVELLDAHRIVDPATAMDNVFEVSDTPQSSLEQFRLQQHQVYSSAPAQPLAALPTNTNLSRIGALPSSSLAPSQSSLCSIATGAAGYSSGDCTVLPQKLQLFLDVKVCIFSVGEDTELLFALYSRQRDCFITEDFVVNLPPPGQPEHTRILGRMKTVFRDLDPADLRDDLWLVCRIFRDGALLYDPKDAKDAVGKPAAGTTTRRCFGCAATCISNANLPAKLGKEHQPPPADLTIYTPTTETSFATFHKTLIDNALGLVRDKEKEMEPAPRAKGIALGLTLFQGEMEEVQQTQRALSGVCETARLGFPALWDPAVERNDLHVRLLHGSFSQDKKSSARNVEVRVRLVRNSDYTDVPGAMLRGSGEDARSVFASSVYYHANAPCFNESFKVSVPASVLPECHLVFEFWHISTTFKKSSVFANSFLALTADGGRVVPDEVYSLPTYKPWAKGDAYLTDESKLQPRGESLSLSLQLASTALTQSSLLTLLSQWKILSKPALLSALQQLTSRAALPDTAQLAHFSRELCTVLLSILANNVYADLHSVVHQALVHVLARLSHEYTPVLEAYAQTASRAEAFPKLLALTAQALEAAVAGIDAAAPAPSPSPSAGPEKGKLPRKSLLSAPSLDGDASPSFGTISRGGHSAGMGAFSRMASMTPEDEDESALIRLARALPVLLELCCATFTAQQAKADSKPALPEGVRAPPPASPASPASVLPLDASPAAFKKHLCALMGHLHALLGAVSETDKKHLPAAQVVLLKRLPALLHALTHGPAAVFSAEDHVEQVSRALDSVADVPHLAVMKLATIKAILTGVSGPLHPPPCSMAAADKCGLTAAITSWSRAWACAHPRYKRRALSGSSLDALVPGLVRHISLALHDAVDRHSLAEPYLCAVLLQHLYTRVHANGTPGSAYAQQFPGADAPAADGIGGSKSTFVELLPLLPALTSVLYMLFCAHPAIPLPKDVRDRPSLTPPPQWLLALAFVDLLQDYTTLLCGILDAVSPQQLRDALTALPRDTAAQTLQQLLYVCTRLVPLVVYPPTWLTLSMFQLRVVVNVAHAVAPILTAQLAEGAFPALTWCYWLSLCLDVKHTSLLEPNDMSVAKRVFVAERYGDVRKGTHELCLELWRAAGDKDRVQTAFLLVEKLLRLVADAQQQEHIPGCFDLYFDLLASQFHAAGDFSEIERHSIDALYELANASAEQGSRCMALLYEAVLERFKRADDAAMGAAGAEFLEHMKTLFALMSSLFAFPDEPQYEDDRTSVALRLISYIERTGHSASTRKAMHTRYVQYLVDLHANNNNHVEAGIAQLQQARVLDWADTPVDAFAGHPAETERERKERLIRQAIQHFVRAEDWERGVDRGDYLRHYYQHMVFDYTTLAEVMADQAIYFTKIVHSERFYSHYFRVCFYGTFDDDALTQPQPEGPPTGEYVFKGNQFESMMDFTNRLKRRFPDAHFHMSSDRPSDQLLSQHPRVVSIVILAIPPHEQRSAILQQYAETRGECVDDLLLTDQDRFEQWSFNSAPIASQVKPAAAPWVRFSAEPTHVSKYKDHDNVAVLEYSRPWRRTVDNQPSANEFSDLWLVRTYLVVQEAFPSNRRRIPVRGRLEQVVQPIVTAVEAVEKKTRELQVIMLSVRQHAGANVDVGPLSMNLNGMIDAAVNGGTNKYLEAFLTPAFVAPESVVLDEEKQDVAGTLAERRRLQGELKGALRHQIAVLQQGLDLFGEKCSEKLRGLYEHLCGFYDQMTVKTQHILE
jgi:hypothetical protein